MKALGKKLGKKVRLNKLIEKVTNNLTSKKLQNMALRLKKQMLNVQRTSNLEKNTIFIDSRRKKNADRRSNYNNKRDVRFKRTLRDTLNRGELVYALAVRLRKKDTPGKLYKSSTKRESCFNKDQVSAVQKRIKSSDSKYFYWISEKMMKL